MEPLKKIENSNQHYPSALTGNEITQASPYAPCTETDNFDQPWGTINIFAKKQIVYRIRIGSEVPDWIHNVIAKLNEFLTLEENWDSYGAEKIDVNSTIFVFEMLTELIKIDITEPFIFPSNDGGIQMEWHKADVDFEIKINPDRNVEFLFDDDRNEFNSIEEEFVFIRSMLPTNFTQTVENFLSCVNNR